MGGKFKGTPGKWRFSNAGGGPLVTTSEPGILEGSKKVCDLSDFDKSVRVIHANGKLIASAPDLLEALQDLIHTYEVDGNLENYNVDAARAIIKKALNEN